MSMGLNEINKRFLTAFYRKTFQTDYHNLDVIISAGNRVKSVRGTQFHIWTTDVLEDYMEELEETEA